MDLILNNYSGQSQIKAQKSITLASGFHVTSGQNVRIFISRLTYQTLNSAPSNDQNYIITNNYKKSFTTPPTTPTTEDLIQQIMYFDGMGRKIQVISTKGSPTMKDIVQHIEYDNFGRESKKYLPYASSNSENGSYNSTAGSDVMNYYAANGWDTSVKKTTVPFAETLFEDSPLNRLQIQAAPGESWQLSSGHTIHKDYGTNVNDDVKFWKINTAGNGASATFYLQGKLYKTVTKDENWTSGKTGTVEEFKDFEEKIVLKRIWETEDKKLDTYYIYDHFKSLKYVIPPAVITNNFTESDSDFNLYIYGYKYDGRRRLIEKKIPGKGWEYIVYNKRSQVVQIQDAVQRLSNQWLFTKYDAFGRIVMTGIHTRSSSREAEQAYILNNEIVFWENRAREQSTYGNVSYPRTNTTVRSINYYDDYTFEQANNLTAEGITHSRMLNGLLTGTVVYKEDGSLPLLTALYYDDDGRLIQTVSQNNLGGKDIITYSYSFTGELLTSVHSHTANGQTTTIATHNKYDHVGRLMTSKQQINNQPEITLLAKNYNEIGQLREKVVGADTDGNNPVNIITYGYNERGWLTTSTSKYFSQQLKYQDPIYGTSAQWNGNISEQHWGQNTTVNEYFVYSYDKLNRLKNGNSTTSGMYESLEYDDMGNITKLTRNGAAIFYSYTGNNLNSVSGLVNGNYTYDSNGNVKIDRTGMNMSYNYLNLPQQVTGGGNTITYLYDAIGNKLRKTANTTGQRDYIGGIEYQNGAIELIHTAEGVAYRNVNGDYTYRYNLTDHLGNVRATIYRNPNTNAVEVLQRDDYYPFGLQKSPSPVFGNNKYLYNGKEKQEELGGQLDYGVRLYDPVIGRWNVVDPLASEEYDLSPYRYGYNNPLRFMDPDGMLEDDILYNQKGKEIDRIVNNLPDRYFMQYDRGNYSYNGSRYVQVNSRETILGDLREIAKGNEKTGFDGKLDSYTKKLGPIVAEATSKTNMGIVGGIALESLEPKNVYGGTGKGNLDFVSEFKADVLYEINGTYYSKHEALNYVWGAAMKTTGQNIGIFLSAADAYHKVHNRTTLGNEPSHNEAIKKGFYNAPGRQFQIYSIPQYYNEKKWLSRPIGK
ncbi:DUF6443 domain-containing protein [Sphingobacterium spiritivorum]|uniref:DUF6443 domain-containing protein n=1 Tax=Sphingobacterium spiritivorum TaxID=258 RepID=UPI001F48BF64|nr:DUF6443 domain-containing protein [Sphingobacterium spiritivorum]